MVRCIQGAKTLSLPMQMLGQDLKAKRINYNNSSLLKWCISFSSPYMNMVIRELFKITEKKDKKGKTLLKRNGEPMRLPSHSFLVNFDIATEKNKAAAENVFIICTLIERAGDNLPRIRASTIIERNPQLAEKGGIIP